MSKYFERKKIKIEWMESPAADSGRTKRDTLSPFASLICHWQQFIFAWEVAIRKYILNGKNIFPMVRVRRLCLETHGLFSHQIWTQSNTYGIDWNNVWDGIPSTKREFLDFLVEKWYHITPAIFQILAVSRPWGIQDILPTYSGQTYSVTLHWFPFFCLLPVPLYLSQLTTGALWVPNLLLGGTNAAIIQKEPNTI